MSLCAVLPIQRIGLIFNLKNSTLRECHRTCDEVINLKPHTHVPFMKVMFSPDYKKAWHINLKYIFHSSQVLFICQFLCQFSLVGICNKSESFLCRHDDMRFSQLCKHLLCGPQIRKKNFGKTLFHHHHKCCFVQSLYKH